MSEGPKDNKWYVTPNAARKRKKIQVTLSDEAREKLERLSKGGFQSHVVECLILDAPEKKK